MEQHTHASAHPHSGPCMHAHLLAQAHSHAHTHASVHPHLVLCMLAHSPRHTQTHTQLWLHTPTDGTRTPWFSSLLTVPVPLHLSLLSKLYYRQSSEMLVRRAQTSSSAKPLKSCKSPIFHVCPHYLPWTPLCGSSLVLPVPHPWLCPPSLRLSWASCGSL